MDEEVRKVFILASPWDYELRYKYAKEFENTYLTCYGPKWGMYQERAMNEAYVVLFLVTKQEYVPDLCYVKKLNKRIITFFIGNGIKEERRAMIESISYKYGDASSPSEIIEKLDSIYPTLKEELLIKEPKYDICPLLKHFVVNEDEGIIEYGFYPQEKADLSIEEISKLKNEKGQGAFLRLENELYYFEKEDVYYKASPIRWKIVKKENGVIYAVSEKVLDAVNFDSYSNADSAWEREMEDRGLGQYSRSEIRVFLLNYFLDNAFYGSDDYLLENEDGEKISLISDKQFLDESFDLKDRRASATEYTLKARRIDGLQGNYWTKDCKIVCESDGKYTTNGVSCFYGVRPIIILKIN